MHGWLHLGLIRCRPTAPHPCGANRCAVCPSCLTAVGSFPAVGLMQGGTPRIAGCVRCRYACVIKGSGRGEPSCVGLWCGRGGMHAHPVSRCLHRLLSHAPRKCGVLPCVEPTVRTVGMSTRALQFTQRPRMGVWIHAKACSSHAPVRATPLHQNSAKPPRFILAPVGEGW